MHICKVSHHLPISLSCATSTLFIFADSVTYNLQVLHVAIIMKQEKAVQALLDTGFSSMTRNSRRWTALDEAIATRHHGITKLLYTHAYAYKKQRMKEKKAQLLVTCNELPNYSVKVRDKDCSTTPCYLHCIKLLKTAKRLC